MWPPSDTVSSLLNTAEYLKEKLFVLLNKFFVGQQSLFYHYSHTQNDEKILTFFFVVDLIPFR